MQYLHEIKYFSAYMQTLKKPRGTQIQIRVSSFVLSRNMTQKYFGPSFPLCKQTSKKIQKASNEPRYLAIITSFLSHALKCQRTETYWMFGTLLPPLSWGFRFFRTLTLGYNPFYYNIGVKCWSGVKGILIAGVGKGEQDQENKEYGSRKIEKK